MNLVLKLPLHFANMAIYTQSDIPRHRVSNDENTVNTSFGVTDHSRKHTLTPLVGKIICSQSYNLAILVQNFETDFSCIRKTMRLH